MAMMTGGVLAATAAMFFQFGAANDREGDLHNHVERLKRYEREWNERDERHEREEGRNRKRGA